MDLDLSDNLIGSKGYLNHLAFLRIIGGYVFLQDMVTIKSADEGLDQTETIQLIIALVLEVFEILEAFLCEKLCYLLFLSI